MIIDMLRTCARWTIDFALPSRFADWRTMVIDAHSICLDCWKRAEREEQRGLELVSCAPPGETFAVDALSILPNYWSENRS